MNIKRRLFISNFLMLVIPVILSLIITSGIMFGAIEIMDFYNGKYFGEKNDKLFYDSIKKTNGLVDRWSQSIDIELMKADVNSFNEKHKSTKISLSIYQEKKLVYPSSPITSNSVVDTALSQGGSHTFIMDNMAVYRESIDKYSILLTDTDFQAHNNEEHEAYHSYLINLGIIVTLFIIIIIILTNRFLTRFVFKSIITPLDTLVYGVHQIRDGNLNYHIEYEGKDEFAGVCSDFNEMAQRLLDSVNARQKDEANRKELIAGISHDLRTPLTSIKAYVEGIEKGVASTPETQKRYLDTIKNKTNDLEHIVNQLFLFSKLDIGEFPLYLEQINIGKEVSNMVASLSEEYQKKGLSIELTQNVENVYAQIDIVQFRNAVINILENSVKYKTEERGQMKISCQEEGPNVAITLADNGPGVSSEAIEKLFDIFYRGDRARTNPSKGSGLGLSITAKILEKLGGSIRAENVPEGGLAIIMILPKYTGGKGVEENFDY
ncbi:sensor histidine kinase [Clostridium magnum]|uniref:histidine kinase n=1 Tax=Clostridium magnum DSM 2767 TaxID=1121326 RepID=A0A162SQ70_9CLOT|nr:HAMP domain-containing sensor histidine kinase [Clostridium magnum]KZL91724.1 signal transduction histidine-protein kinase BaeS [Clostridium magnum DSM 2767]SHJ04239.1 Signal transduction histidine kinase [Clostridium magnum DSM 2767]